MKSNTFVRVYFLAKSRRRRILKREKDPISLKDLNNELFEVKNSCWIMWSVSNGDLCGNFFTITQKINFVLREVVEVRLTSAFEITTYIFGISHNSQEYYVVLVSWGRIKNLPGQKYHMVRGNVDVVGVQFYWPYPQPLLKILPHKQIEK